MTSLVCKRYQMECRAGKAGKNYLKKADIVIFPALCKTLSSDGVAVDTWKRVGGGIPPGCIKTALSPKAEIVP